MTNVSIGYKSWESGISWGFIIAEGDVSQRFMITNGK